MKEATVRRSAEPAYGSLLEGDQPLTDVSPLGRAGSARLFPYRCFPPAKPALTLPQANIFDRSGFATTAEAERVRIPEEEE
jgi:hypothetical protein